MPLTESDIQLQLDLRKPGQSVITTQRKEEDKVEIISGVFNGFTTGAPICMVIWNKDMDSRSYELIRTIPRPGHSDYPAMIKYGGFADYRGSGRFSGRLTATLVMAGAIAQKLLEYSLGIKTTAYTLEIGGIRAKNLTLEEIKKNRYTNEVRCPDMQSAEYMRSAIMEARKDGDSLGGVVECISTGLPIGLGEPIFGSIESNSGGILGGLSNSMPIVIRIAFKPAASIAKTQKTIDVSNGSETKLNVPGRHDPCVVPRAPPIVESVVSMVLADHALRAGFIPLVLKR
ncbi:MAG: chorismate synthase [Nitrososphaeraceae archaeon]|nr:chorismate synthase [Nitrososphaeraceae archaeon]